MKLRYAVTLRGRTGSWSVTFDAKPEHVEGMRADGLVIDELVNTAPEWAVSLGLLRPWCWTQDAWRWMRLW